VVLLEVGRDDLKVFEKVLVANRVRIPFIQAISHHNNYSYPNCT
jgi:hypothetical protein